MKYTLYRGAPYKGLDLDDLQGGGGRGQEMLGSGLYTSDDIAVASIYADELKGGCVYTLELDIPENKILRIERAYYPSENFKLIADLSPLRGVDKDLFGVEIPALIFQVKNQNTQEWVTYILLDGDLDDESVKWYIEKGYMPFSVSDVTSPNFKKYFPKLSSKFQSPQQVKAYYEEIEYDDDKLDAFLKEFGDELDGTLGGYWDIDDLVDECFDVSSYLGNLYGLDLEKAIEITAEDFSDVASGNGYSVMWADESVIGSGSEVLIVDDDIYDNGLVITDDCTDRENPKEDFLYNHVDGSYFWYHVSRRRACQFQKGEGFHSGVAFFAPTLDQVLKFTNSFKEHEKKDDIVTVCKVKIKNGKFFESDILSYEAQDEDLDMYLVFQDPERNLTPFALELSKYLSRYAKESEHLESVFYGLMTRFWMSYDPEGRYEYLSKYVFRFLKRNGFRGWYETEEGQVDGYNNALYEEEINLAVIYPEEDVIVVESVELNLYEQDF
jgi:hypothetical protein